MTHMHDTELASMQLIGYSYAKKGVTIIQLIDAMGLTEMEWSLIKIKSYPTYMLDIDIKLIDEYFENKKKL